MRPLVLVVALVASALGAGGIDAEGEILVGTGQARLEPGVDHASLVSRYGAIGFDLDGDGRVRYEYVRGFDSGGTRHLVSLLAPAGELRVPWALAWVFEGPADVVFEGAHGTDCTNFACDDGPLP